MPQTKRAVTTKQPNKDEVKLRLQHRQMTKSLSLRKQSQIVQQQGVNNLGGPNAYLQRTVGNQAIGSLSIDLSKHSFAIGKDISRNVICRYEIEGPFNKNEPVHEVLTLLAIKRALTALKDKKKGMLLRDVNAQHFPRMTEKRDHNIEPKKIDPSAQQFIRGVIWPDDPKGYLFDDEKTTEDYSSGLMWWEEFDPDEKDEPEELIARSHYGDLQFFHAMATQDNENPKETKKKIMEWSRFLTDISTGRIDPKSKVADIPFANQLFTAHRHLTIKQLFGYKDAKDQDIRQRATGALFHLVQDSNARGHVGRDPKSSAIKQFRSYKNQDHDKHAADDGWAEGKNLGERLKNTPGAEKAIAQCAEILVMLDKGATTEEVLKFLDTQIFQLDPKAEMAGPGANFKEN